MKRYELASNGTQKSFYGKAVVEIDNAGFMGLGHKPTPQEKAAAYNGTLCR